MSDHIDDAKRLEVEERVNVSFELKSDDEGFNSVREIIDQAMLERAAIVDFKFDRCIISFELKRLKAATEWPWIFLPRNHADAIAELVRAVQEVIRISDRKHDAWDAAKAALEKLDGGKS